MPRRLEWLIVLASLTVAANGGCDARSPAFTGSPYRGTVVCQGTAMPEVRVELHAIEGESNKPLAFGATGVDGTFALFDEGGKAPNLPPGEYRVTLEHLGAGSMSFSLEASSAKSTPLRCRLIEAGQAIAIEVPAELVQRETRDAHAS